MAPTKDRSHRKHCREKPHGNSHPSCSLDGYCARKRPHKGIILFYTHNSEREDRRTEEKRAQEAMKFT
ncbi:hypothetical protein P5673_011763 [Acropora cervicornis]|uniref:Uncharacterized protein n=1 Tax=Acropora cervicornis TaxID=6130 RepID=A0AAD9QPH8_ACRCE|nr:hypothetical protein P5673_011763 [Acropora cervicornis]